MTAEQRPLRLPAAPAEGWLTLAIVGVMAYLMASAIDDAGWVLGGGHLTDFLVIATLLGVVAGFLGSKIGWNRWIANLVGAIFAALIVPVLVGQVLEPGQSIGFQYQATADQSLMAWTDLIILRLQATRAIGHHLLILGLLCWGTGQFAASAVFRHHRPLSAVVVIGAILVANMAASLHQQEMFLVLFSVAALFLLTRLHALDEEATWARRRIGDPNAVRAIYLRGGAVFILVAVLGSMTLTATARSQPLAGAWDDLKPWLLDMSGSIQRFLPMLEESRGIGGVQFGPQAPIRGFWFTDGGLALTVRRDPADDFPYYWRAIAYDRYNNLGWEWTGGTDTQTIPRPAGTELLEGSADRVLAPGTKDLTFQVTPDDLRGNYIVSPLAPLSIDHDSELLAAGDDAFFQAVQINGHEPYSVKARVPLRGDDKGGVTGNKLAAAGQGYPPEILARYTQLPPDAVGVNAQAVLDDVLLKLKANGVTENPYDLSVALVNELQSRRFKYNPNVAEMQAECDAASLAECFATFKEGYCEHYATLMAVLLRHQHIPARVAYGFLPGDLNPQTGVEPVPNAAAHAWVEVWFPGYGWYPFDPTGGGVADTVPLPSGAPVASAPPSQIRSLAPFPIDDEIGQRSPGTAGVVPPGNGGVPPAGYLLITAILLTTLAIAAFLVWRRGPRGAVTPEGAWLGIGKLAARFGFGQRPTQTAYEYANVLGEVLPGMRPALDTVATARVEVAYGGRVLEEDRIRALRDAYTKLRVGLLRLLFRRGKRQKR